MTLVSVVVIKLGCRSELSSRWACPCSRIEHEIFVRIDTMRVEILQEQRRTGHSVHESTRCTSRRIHARGNGLVGGLEQQSLEVVLAAGRLDREAARVRQHAAYCPAFYKVADQLVTS